MLNKEKKKLFIYMISIFVVVSIIALAFLLYSNTFIMEYKMDDIYFKYYSDFIVRKNDDFISIKSKDEVCDIKITISSSDSNYSYSNYLNVFNQEVEREIDLNKYKTLSSECVDHMCNGIYESDKEKIKFVVEFRENTLIDYKYSVPKNNFNKYNDGFELIVNSFVKK